MTGQQLASSLLPRYNFSNYDNNDFVYIVPFKIPPVIYEVKGGGD